MLEQPIGGFSGLFEALSPVKRPLGALSSVSNLVIEQGSVLTTRPGLAQVGGQVAAAKVNGIHPYYNTVSGSSQLLAHVGTGLYRWDDATESWETIDATALADAPSTSCHLNDLLLIWDGTNKKKWDGTTLADLGGSPPAAKYAISAYEQVFVTGISDRPADVDFCDVAAPETWTPAPGNDAGSISVGAKEGDFNTWVGFDKIQGKIIIWSRYGIIVLHGPDTPNRPGLWSVQAVLPYGTPNGRTVRRVGKLWIWLSDDGFVTWGGGSTEPVREPIKNSFALIDWSNIANACAWVDKDERYWCCVPVTSGGVKYFCFDPGHGWFTGTGKDIRASGSYRFSGKETPLVGDKDGNIYKIEGDDDAGAAIDWEAIVGPSLFGESGRKKELAYVNLLLSLASEATAYGAVSTAESGAFGSDKEVTANETITQVELAVPFEAEQLTRAPMFRLKLHGSGKVNLYDAVLSIRKAGK